MIWMNLMMVQKTGHEAPTPPFPLEPRKMSILHKTTLGKPDFFRKHRSITDLLENYRIQIVFIGNKNQYKVL